MLLQGILAILLTTIAVTVAFADDNNYVVLGVRQTPYFSTKLSLDGVEISTFESTPNIQQIQSELERQPLTTATKITICYLHSTQAPSAIPNSKNLATLSIKEPSSGHLVLHSAAPSGTQFSAGSETCKDHFVHTSETGLLVTRLNPVPSDPSPTAPPMNIIPPPDTTTAQSSANPVAENNTALPAEPAIENTLQREPSLSDGFSPSQGENELPVAQPKDDIPPPPPL
ncbi:MAG: hypothetical protein KDD59_03615 [Bdellovibrionales bacterium]|nr:hypothetical protein [Bdellovibrionales bacterium]